MPGFSGYGIESQVSAEELKTLLHVSPFRPFTIYTVAEKAFSIPHPDSVWISPRGRTVIIGHTEDEAFEILDIPLISRIAVHDQTKPAS